MARFSIVWMLPVLCALAAAPVAAQICRTPRGNCQAQADINLGAPCACHPRPASTTRGGVTPGQWNPVMASGPGGFAPGHVCSTGAGSCALPQGAGVGLACMCATPFGHDPGNVTGGIYQPPTAHPITQTPAPQHMAQGLVCKAEEGTCPVPAGAKAGASCSCLSPLGTVAGTVAAGEMSVPAKTAHICFWVLGSRTGFCNVTPQARGNSCMCQVQTPMGLLPRPGRVQ